MVGGVAPLQTDEREPARPERGQHTRRSVGRNDQPNRVGADLDTVDDSNRSISTIEQKEFIRTLVHGEKILAAGENGQVRQSTANIVLGHDLSRRRIDDREATATAIGDEQALAPVGDGKRDRLAHARRERLGVDECVPRDTSALASTETVTPSARERTRSRNDGRLFMQFLFIENLTSYDVLKRLPQQSNCFVKDFVIGSIQLLIRLSSRPERREPPGSLSLALPTI